MWELDCEESWVPKNWCFWTMVVEKTLESPLDCKEIQPVHPRGDQSWVFIEGTDAEAETSILWPPHAKSWLIGKDSDAGRDWGQEEKGMTEDEMAGWHHQLYGHEFGWTPEVGDGQGGLACCNSWGFKSQTWLSDWTELKWMKIITSFKIPMHTLPHSWPPALWQATVDPWLPQRLLDTHGQVWVSVLWGHCSFFLGFGVHKILFVPSKILFPQSCVSSDGGVNGNLLQKGLCHTQLCCTQSPCPCIRPLLTGTFAGGTHTQFWFSLHGVSGSWCTQDLFEPSEHVWWVRCLILNVISPLLPSCWDFAFALGCGISIFGGIQHSQVDGGSAASCSFGVLVGEDECISLCSAIFLPHYGVRSNIMWRATQLILTFFRTTINDNSSGINNNHT